MKTKGLFITVILLLLIKSFNAQNPVFREATLSHPAQLWKPVGIGNNGSNEISGLQFYSFDSECNSEKVVLVKLVNLNPDPLAITYQVSEGAPVIRVTVPALFTIEGACSSNDKNIQNLVLAVFNNKTDAEKEKIQKYLFSHLTITKIQ